LHIYKMSRKKTPLLDRRGGRLERSDRLPGWWIF
jgi:hypothetical protein